MDNFTWTLDFLDTVWCLMFGLGFVLIVAYHVVDKIEEIKNKRVG